MSTTTNPLASVSQVQNGIIGSDQTDKLNTRNQVAAETAPSGVHAEGLYLAFVDLKDITDGYGEGILKYGILVPRPKPDPHPDYGVPDPKPKRGPCEFCLPYAIPDEKRFEQDKDINKK